MSGSPLDDVLAALRATLERRRADAQDRTARIKAAADAYLSAVEHELARDLASAHGLKHSATVNTREAAHALRRLIDALPELSDVSRSRDEESAVIPAPPVETQVQSGHSDNFVYEAPNEARELLREVQNLDFETMPVAVFRVYAAELAARARSLQDRGLEAENIPGRIIRKLTAVAHAKGVTNIRGLARWHQDDWVEAARRHRAARERLMQQADAPPPSTSRPPPRESEYPSIIIQVDEEDEETEVRHQTLPHLQAAAGVGAIVLVGGMVKREKLERLQERFSITIEWIDTKRAGMNSVGNLENRLRDGRISALVILDGLIGHIHSEPLVQAARRAGVPLAYGDRGGMGSIARAFSEIETQLTQRSQGSAAG